MRLSDKLVQKHPRPATGQAFLWDDLLQGYGVRFTPTKVAHVIQWREAGGRKPRVTLEHWAAVSVTSARELAHTELGKVTRVAAYGGGVPLRSAMRTWEANAAADASGSGDSLTRSS